MKLLTGLYAYLELKVSLLFNRKVLIHRAQTNLNKSKECLEARMVNLAMYGKAYQNTLEYAQLEFQEKFYFFKYEFYNKLIKS